MGGTREGKEPTQRLATQSPADLSGKRILVLGRLDLAAVISPEEGAGLGLDALRDALAGREVVALGAEEGAAGAIREISGHL